MTPNREIKKICTPTSQTSTIEYARSTESCNVSQIGNGDKKDSNFDDVQKRVATYVYLFRIQLLNGLSRNIEFHYSSGDLKADEIIKQLFLMLFSINNGCRRS